MSGFTSLLLSVLGVFALALVVRLVVRNQDRVAFASALVFIGVVVSAVGLSFDLPLTDDLILTIFLPTIIFHGTTTIDVQELWRNTSLIVVLTVIGLPLAVVILGVVGSVAFGFPLLVALLFATIILPTDPAAVLSIFDELDVAEQLAVTIEGESLLNDGVAIVIFSAVVAAFEASGSVAALATPRSLVGIAGDIALVGGGGLVLGMVVGYLAHIAMRQLDDRMSILLLTVLVTYGSFLLAEHFLGVSGILAVVGAGLLMGAHEETHHKMSTSESHVQELWTTAAFLVTTMLYVLIGAEIRIDAFIENAGLVVSAAILVVVVRAATIYPLVTGTNLIRGQPVPLYCQHVMVWGGLHTVVPVALVLSLPQGFPFREQLQVMVFGVAVISIVVQGLLMPPVLTRLGLGDSSGG
ncbi:cation:proton antiporter [Halapricum hydrolyticum]|uniref:Sodium:proton antiporter n=1 Tax=Halapricum hydrolyticum TaxID=2979991 RepID=A0AAE3IC39_9EURY|nr:sodium:proton antiporter [Halapricum hydrolyticum]MCU4718090.1 sodium:proton antiporter [Halapricum hydrolyticum]MCU4727402.1 sodium:proton antiporter [Halapricum hydrolyticum]